MQIRNTKLRNRTETIIIVEKQIASEGLGTFKTKICLETFSKAHGTYVFQSNLHIFQSESDTYQSKLNAFEAKLNILHDKRDTLRRLK